MTDDIGEISVAIDDAGWPGLVPDLEARLVATVRATLGAACPGLDGAGIAILLTNDAAVHELNRTWRGKDSPTNVLSFPATETQEGDMPQPDFPGAPLELGDIAIARETCEREAKEQYKSIADHVLHLTVHGTLHLLGYDHEADDQAERMERLETAVLAGIGIKDPYLITEPPDHE